MLIRNGKCENCPCFEANVIDAICYNGSKILNKAPTVVCENKDLCDRLEKYLIEKISVE